MWFSTAIFLAGILFGGIPMLIRGDFLGRKAADEVKRESMDADNRLSKDIDEAEKRMNERINREMGIIGREVREIKETLVRIEGRFG